MSNGHVAVSMYRIGFGDAFLMRLPTDNGQRTVLIDCGRHFQTPKKKVKNVDPPLEESAIVERIIEDVTDDQGTPRIDLVIATHRHQDHVSGFSRKEWANVVVKEVWMPWTEHPTDPEAIRIRNTQSALAKRLDDDIRRLGLNDLGLRALVANSLSNESAMNTLHHGFSGGPRRKFLTGRMQTLKPALLPGVRVHVLGPSRDEDVIREMDPPEGQSFLRARDPSRALTDGRREGPFGSRFRLTPAAMKKIGPSELLLSRGQTAFLEELAQGDPLLVAAALEKAVNGTSLMLAFEVGKAMLLFPGDAQWGTWKRALASAKARGILKRTTFYKVGHHGSHNATPTEFVNQLLEDDTLAMASVWPIAQFPRIPKQELVLRLLEKHVKFARADAPPADDFSFDDGVVEAKVATD
jgi:beta-lactamase superfamily II metal-dependent hydrolase